MDAKYKRSLIKYLNSNCHIYCDSIDALPEHNGIDLFTCQSEITFDVLQKLSQLFGTKNINVGSRLDYGDCYYEGDNPSTQATIMVCDITTYPKFD
jgi:hypothetical protein